MAVELEAAVVSKPRADTHAQQRDRPPAVQARHEQVRKQLAAALGAHARDVEGSVEEVRAI